MPAPDYASEIANLESALASGELEIEGANGDRVKYRSTDELRKALSYYQGRASAASSPSAPVAGVTLAAFDRF